MKTKKLPVKKADTLIIPKQVPVIEPEKKDSNIVTLKVEGKLIDVAVGTEASKVCDMLLIIKSGRKVYIDGVPEDEQRYITKDSKEITLV